MTEREDFENWMHDKCPKGSRILTNLLAYRFGVIDLEDVFKAGRASMRDEIMEIVNTEGIGITGVRNRLKELGDGQ